jgi:hypothetical protein
LTAASPLRISAASSSPTPYGGNAYCAKVTGIDTTPALTLSKVDGFQYLDFYVYVPSLASNMQVFVMAESGATNGYADLWEWVSITTSGEIICEQYAVSPAYNSNASSGAGITTGWNRIQVAFGVNTPASYLTARAFNPGNLNGSTPSGTASVAQWGYPYDTLSIPDQTGLALAYQNVVHSTTAWPTR